MNILLRTEVVLLSLEHLHEGLGAERFGPLDGKTKGAVPDERGQDAKSATHAEHDRVIIHFRQAVVLKQNSRVSVNVGPGVLRLSLLQKNVRHQLVHLRRGKIS